MMRTYHSKQWVCSIEAENEVVHDLNGGDADVLLRRALISAQLKVAQQTCCSPGEL